MNVNSSPPTRRNVLATSAGATAVPLPPALRSPTGDALGQQLTQGESQMATNPAIRPFSINFPEDALVDLRRRINTTKWPDKEQVPDTSQGVQLATMQSL